MAILLYLIVAGGISALAYLAEARILVPALALVASWLIWTALLGQNGMLGH